MPLVKPLKFGSNGIPRQVQSNADTLGVAGLDLEALGTHLLNRVGNDIILKDPSIVSQFASGVKLKELLDAEFENFDPMATDLVSLFTGPAIRELANRVTASASPGFGWGAPGSIGAGSYLLNDSIESNKSGRLVPFNGYVDRFFFIESKKTGTRTLELVKRTTPGTGSYSAIAEVQATGTTAFGNADFPAPPTVGSVAVSLNEELAVRVKSGSADLQDVIAGVIIKT